MLGANINSSKPRPKTASSVIDRLVTIREALEERTKAVKAQLVKDDSQKEGIPSDLTLDNDYEENRNKKSDSNHLAQAKTSPVDRTLTMSLHYFRQFEENDRMGSRIWGTVKHGAIDGMTLIYRIWLGVLSLTFLYNFWAITLRASFPLYQATFLIGWMIADYLCDILMLCNMIFVQPRIIIFENGSIVYNRKVLRKKYLTSRRFKLDVLTLLPFDLLYIAVGYVQPMFRVFRLLGIRYYFELFDRLARNSTKPDLFRMLKTIIYILMTVHLYACVYYVFSDHVIGIGNDEFVFEGGQFEDQVYSRCFYVTFKIAARIGAQEKVPQELSERLLITLFWLIALCVEIVLLAQVREIFLSITREDDEFGRLLSIALGYVRRYKCPLEIEKKVLDWFNYTRDTQKTLDDQDIIRMLPKHLRKDLALDIHFELLSKASIFDGCEYSVLADIVVKLKASLYFPNDIIYKKGDVGKQMFIIEKGQAEVLDDNGKVAVTLTEGAVFGENSLVTFDAVTRRTTTVRSKGYSNIFTLSKEEFKEILTNYPRIYRRLLKLKRKSMANKAVNPNENNEATQISIANPVVDVLKPPPRPVTPKMFRLLMKLLPGRSMLKRMIKVHPSIGGSVTSINSTDYDPELAVLDWSSPSPDNFYVPQNWELKHFRLSQIKRYNAEDDDDEDDDVFEDAKVLQTDDYFKNSIAKPTKSSPKTSEVDSKIKSKKRKHGGDKFKKTGITVSRKNYEKDLRSTSAPQ